MQFRIADTFTASLAKLTGEEQKAVKTTAFDLQMNPARPGLKLHQVDRSKDKSFWSARVSRDIRLIVHRTATRPAVDAVTTGPRSVRASGRAAPLPRRGERRGAGAGARLSLGEVDRFSAPFATRDRRAGLQRPGAGIRVGRDGQDRRGAASRRAPVLRCRSMVAPCSERRWRVTGRGRGVFTIEVDDGDGFRAATAAEVDAALRQRELFGAEDYPLRPAGEAERMGDERRHRLTWWRSWDELCAVGAVPASSSGEGARTR